MTIIQWVNLEKDSDFLNDPDIDSLDRCGKLTIKTAFAENCVDISYKVKVSDVGTDNVTYSTAELARNTNFKMTKGASDVGTEDEVLMEDTIQLPAAGGNKYKLDAKDANGVEVTSVNIEAKRKLYYQFMHMEDANDKVTPYALTQLETHCEKYAIKLSKITTASDKKIPFHKCINSTKAGRFNHVGFANDIKAKYDLKNGFNKIGCVTALSNYIATFKLGKITITHTIGGVPDPACTILTDKINLWVIDKGFLWYGLDPEDDNDKTWFIKGAISFIPSPTSTIPAREVEFFKNDVAIAGSDIRTHGGRREIYLKIKLGSALESFLAQPSGSITFALEFNVIKGFSGGFSWGGAGFALTTCCTKAWFEDKNKTASDVIWNHEIGHRMGMIAHGNSTLVKNTAESDGVFIYRKKHQKSLPDAPSTLYGENHDINGNGHQGPHCNFGSITYDAAKNKWTGVPGCVLFGSTGATDSAGKHHSSPLDYCVNCGPIVRKLDLSFS